jgi:Ca-activated chloride channel family protein
MVTFLWPDALWLLVALPALVIAYVESCWRRQRAYVRYATLRLVHEALASPQRLRRHAPPLVFFFGLAAALLAVAHPAAVTTAQPERGTVILAIDVSPSMAVTDVAPTRLAAAQAAMANFVRAQPGNVRIGIVAFGGNAQVVQSPTADRSEVLAALERLALQPYTGIGTALIAAVLAVHPGAGVDNRNDIFLNGWEAAIPRGAFLAAFHPVERSQKRITTPIDFSTAIVLVSDGVGTIGVSPVKAAEIAAQHGIRVYTVGVGTPYGGSGNVAGWGTIHAEFQEEVLKEIARVTRGEYFHARNAGKLERIYDQLTREAVLERRTTEITVPLVLIAVALLLAASVLSLLWWHRSPLPPGEGLGVRGDGGRLKTLW